MTPTPVAPNAEDRMLLRVSCETYDSLMADHADKSSPRFTYDHGVLEIMTPFTIHERYTVAIGSIVEIAGEELGVDVDQVGSTTFRRGRLQGFEPDTSFYIKNEAAVRGKDRLNLDVDPPPDIVVEIEITSALLPKLPLLLDLQVPEVWRYDGKKVDILKLVGLGIDASYSSVPTSPALPAISAEALTALLAFVGVKSPKEWRQAVRAWAQTLAVPSDR